jgi:hypothetical protein
VKHMLAYLYSNKGTSFKKTHLPRLEQSFP